ncbi:outer membrane beta-barrel protein [Salegentibacter flavus]|uniref:Outer membrane protein beta-barrel domain-containing protein n=1 Tax=Salegentibacter flavus TaxID=287099 RepID=A0A1I5BR55_9FLAO|nr:outer membrane beta-barrel protein [Salegentibacter flavus]SFN77137.1 Outer membrane protein beta-barrel domain-containing protein [Salegentibacter flavus]
MFRDLLVALLFMGIFESAQSQAFKSPSVNISVQAGYLAIDPSYSTFYPEVSEAFITGEAGLFIGVNYNLRLNRDFSIVPEVSFISNKESVHYRVAGLVEYRIPSTSFYSLGGPQVNILSGNSLNPYDRAGFELIGGIGYDISSSFYLEGRYSHEFTNRLKPEAPFEEDDYYRFRSYSIGLGFRF